MTRSAWRLGCAAGAAMLTVWAGHAQTPSRDALRDATAKVAPVGTGQISGVVVSDGESPNHPLRRAIVTLSGGGVAGSVQTATGDDGRFVFAQLPAGRFSLTAEKPAYVKAYYGSKRPGRTPGAPIALANDQSVANITIALLRGAVISGTVRDEFGNPLSSAQVRALQPAVVNGDRKLIDPPGPIRWEVTDDRGMYRIYGLLPGEYTVQAAGGGAGGFDLRQTTTIEIEAAMRELQTPSTRAGSPPSLGTATPELPQISRGTALFPSGNTAATAQTFILAPGEERGGVDIVSSLARVVRVEGFSFGPNGPVSNALVGMANLTRGSLYFSPGFVRPGADGHFTIGGLGPGRYLLFGRGAEGPTDANAPMTLYTETEFTVSGEKISDLMMRFEPGVNVSGRLSFEGTQPPPQPATIRVSLTRLPIVPDAAVFVQPVTVAADGRFTFSGVPAGRYRIAAAGAAPWLLRSAVSGQRDTLDVPLDVAPGTGVTDLVLSFTDRPTEISGTLFDQLGRPTPEYAILIFSTDRSFWTSAPRRMSGLVKLGTDATYHVAGLPPGEYYLSAITDADPLQLGDPSFLEQLIPASIKITLAEGEKKTQNLRLGG